MAIVKKRVFAYVRISQKTQDRESQKLGIYDYCNQKGLQPEFIEESISGGVSWKNRKLNELVNSMVEGDVLVVSEFPRLGRDFFDAMELVGFLARKKISLHLVKYNIAFDDSIFSKTFIAFLGLFSEMEKEFIRARTIEGIENARKKGKILGRPKGPAKSKLDPEKDKIQELLEKGVTRMDIARIYGVHYHTIVKFVEKYSDLKKLLRKKKK